MQGAIAQLKSQGLTDATVGDRLGLSVHKVRRIKRLMPGHCTGPVQSYRPRPQPPFVRVLPRRHPGPIPTDCTDREKAIYGLAIAQCAFSTRTINHLEEAGVLTVWELLHCSQRDLATINNLGPRTIDRILAEVRRLLALIPVATEAA